MCTEIEDRGELVAEVETSSGSDNVTQLLVRTMRVAYTTLKTKGPVRMELLFRSVLSGCAERKSSKGSYEDRLELHNIYF